MCPQTTTSASSPASSSRHAGITLHPGRAILAGAGQKRYKRIPGHTVHRHQILQPPARKGRVPPAGSPATPAAHRPAAPAPTSPARVRAGRSHFAGHSDVSHRARYNSALPRIIWHGRERNKSTTSGAPGKLVDEVAGDEQAVGFLRPEIRQHCLECEEVAVDVAEGCDTHG